MNTYNKEKTGIPEWKLEFYLLGELPRKELDAIRKLEESDETLRKRIADLRADGEAIMAKYPPERMIPLITARLAERAGAPPGGKPRVSMSRSTRPARRPRAFRRLAIPAAALAALLVALPVVTRSLRTDDISAERYAAGGGDRVKGAALSSPVIEVWRKEGDAARLLAPSAAAHTGDIVQLSYTVPDSCYGALVSVDGRGVLTVHLAGDSGKAAPLAPGKPVLLNSAYKLDDAPLFEVFYLITAPDDFEVDEITRMLKKVDEPIEIWEVPELMTITAFGLRKLQDGGAN